MFKAVLAAALIALPLSAHAEALQKFAFATVACGEIDKTDCHPLVIRSLTNRACEFTSIKLQEISTFDYRCIPYTSEAELKKALDTYLREFRRWNQRGRPDTGPTPIMWKEHYMDEVCRQVKARKKDD